MLKLIRFDKNGYAFGERFPWNIESARKGNIVSFGYRDPLDQWTGTEYTYQIGTNGVCSENFFQEVPWYLNIPTNHRIRYWWGHDCLKKLHLCPQRDLVYGASPFVYSTELYQNKPKSNKFQAIFLPKGDGCEEAKGRFTMWSELVDDQAKVDSFLATIEALNVDNPIFIAFPTDYVYWESRLPKSMLSRIFCIGFDRFDPLWNTRMIDLINHCSELYFHMISTPSVYASYMGKKVKFYSTELLNLDDKDIRLKDKPVYTLDRDRTPKIFNEFMEYITDTFENKTSDLGYWITQFLSLDLVKDYDELGSDLLTLEQRNASIRMRLPSGGMYGDYGRVQRKLHNNYDTLLSNNKAFKTDPSELAEYYFNKL